MSAHTHTVFAASITEQLPHILLSAALLDFRDETRELAHGPSKLFKRRHGGAEPFSRVGRMLSRLLLSENDME
jgi:hypothetical protein